MTPASKDEIAAVDRQAWLDRTKNYVEPTSRNVLIVGADMNSIGEGIATVLSRRAPGNGIGEIIAPLDVECYHDLAQPQSVRQFFNRAEGQIDEPRTAEIGGFDTLVCCVGKTYMNWFEDMDQNMMRESVESSLIAPMLIAHEFVRRSIKDPTLKRIIFIGSMAHRAVLTASAPYCAAKAGVAHLVQNLGWELTPKGYRVFGVNPSNVEGTPMTEETIKGIMSYRGLDRAAAERYWGAVNLMPEWLTAERIGEVVATVLDGSLDYMSGSNLDLKAGQR